ncbi:MAG: hypothetical protein ACP5T5_05805 [Thermoprotei archaeon]|nr:hypothetical protein [TACK group archaeon]
MEKMEYPRTAYILVLVGSVFQLLAALFETIGITAFFYVSPAPSRTYPAHPIYMMHAFPTLAIPFVMFIIIVWVFALISLFSAFLIRDNPEAGGILSLIMAIISFVTLWGFLIGSLLMLIGAILALTFRPQQPQPPPSAPSPAPQPSP